MRRCEEIGAIDPFQIFPHSEPSVDQLNAQQTAPAPETSEPSPSAGR